MDKCTKYFLGLEKRNYKNRCISKLKVDHDKIVSDPKEILKQQKMFYEKLYTSSSTNLSYEEGNRLKNIFLTSDIPKLSDIDKMGCEGLLTTTECGEALKEFKNNKSPGTDGFTAEFYKFFWGQIKEIVIQSLNYAYSTGDLSIEQKRGIISLIPKKDKDRMLLKNWRPITLLNVDYKIAAKTLAKRLQNYLPSLINSDQTGYIKGRLIGENIRLISDIITLTDLKNIPGLLLLIDFEKAFDSIEWNYIDLALKSFNFGPNYRKWVKTLYCSGTSCVTNNGYASEFFNLQRSVRQGCPLAPFLFVLVVELMAIAIRNNPNIKGIKVDRSEIKLAQLADDTTCFLQDDLSGQHLINLLKDFSKLSGLKCNLDKTEAIWVGSNKGRAPGRLNVKWSRGPFKTLGVTFALNEKEMPVLNIVPKIEKIKNIFSLWNKRSITIIGRIQIVKSLALSQLTYTATSLHYPKDICHMIQSLIRSFVWKYSNSKVKDNIFAQQIVRGGLKYPLFDIQLKSLKMSFLQRLLLTEGSNCFICFQSWFPYIKLVDLFQTRCLIPPEMTTNLPLFYQDLIYIRAEIMSKEAIRFQNEYLWFNPHIKIDGKPVFYKKWYEKGIKFVKDLINENKQFFLDAELKVKYGIDFHFLEYISLRLAIPRTWRNVPNQKTFLMSNKVSTCKQLYWSLIENNTKNIQQEKWATLFEISDNDIWPKIYLLPFRITYETSLQAFQYSILFRFAPYKKRLMKMGLVNSETCDFCPEVDSLVHRFASCADVKTFWEEFITWWNNIHDENRSSLLEKDIMLGLTNEQNNTFNYCILLAKYSIHSFKCSGVNINLCQFKNILKRKTILDKSVMVRRCKLQTFSEKWGPLHLLANE